MPKIEPGRMTHDHDGELVVFLIGMTVNQPWRLSHWLPVLGAMPRMLRELSQDPESGLLSFRYSMNGIHPIVIQYWDSLDKLYAYASDPHASHRPAWKEFNRRARKASKVVGIWHETFQVSAAESIYANTPRRGLGQGTKLVPAGRPNARERMAAESRHQRQSKLDNRFTARVPRIDRNESRYLMSESPPIGIPLCTGRSLRQGANDAITQNTRVHWHRGGGDPGTGRRFGRRIDGGTSRRDHRGYRRHLRR